MGWKLFIQTCKVALSAVGFWWASLQGIACMGFTVPSWLKDPLVGLIGLPVIILATLLYRIFRLLWSNIHVHGSICEIRVRATSLLKVRGGSIAIGINNELSCDTHRIGENSLHSQLLKLETDQEKPIENAFDAQRGTHSDAKGIYPNGTTFTTSEKVGGHQCFFLVMSNIITDHVIQTSPEALREAFLRFFDAVKTLPVSEAKLAMPIIGSGPAGVNLTEEQILEMAACAFLCQMPRNYVQIRQLTFVVRPRDLYRLNLPLLEQNLRTIAEHCCYLDEGCAPGACACNANTVNPSPANSTSA